MRQVSPRDNVDFNKNCKSLGIAVRNVVWIPVGQMVAAQYRSVFAYWVTSLREDGTLDTLRSQHFPETTTCALALGDDNASTNTLRLSYFSDVFGFLILVFQAGLRRFCVWELGGGPGAGRHTAASRDP